MRGSPIIPEIHDKFISWLKAWPVFLALIMLSFNVEIVVMNILSLKYGIKDWDLLISAVILGNIELICWIWLIGKNSTFIKENPGFRSFYSDIKSKGLDKLFRRTIRAVAEKLDPENMEYQEKIKKIRVGYFDMFLFGVCIGAWVLGIIIFRTTRRYDSLIMLMTGNAVKLSLFAAGYSFLGWIFIPVLILTFIYKVNRVFK